MFIIKVLYFVRIFISFFISLVLLVEFLQFVIVIVCGVFILIFFMCFCFFFFFVRNVFKDIIFLFKNK